MTLENVDASVVRVGDGRTPGPLGLSEVAPRSEGGRRAVRRAGPIGLPELVISVSSDAFSEFKAKVLERQVRNARAIGRVYCPNLPDGELAVIEGKHRMRTEAAEQCRALLQAAREALGGGKASGDSRAGDTAKIGVHSAYRNIDEDTLSWHGSFRQYYDETREKREALPGGAHGSRAVAVMLRMMVSYKAAPGYSNHSNGLAVDFSTTYKRRALKSRKAQREQWRDAWLYRWLLENAASYRFQPLETEEWHWNYE